MQSSFYANNSACKPSFTLCSFLSTTLLFAFLFVSTSCEKVPDVVDGSPVSILTTVKEAPVKSTTDPAYTPENGDLYLHYTTVGNTSIGHSAVFSYVGDSWVTDAPIYWDNIHPIASVGYSFFGLAPSVPSASPAVLSDQSTEASYIASDQLISYASTFSKIPILHLPFKHVLSQLRVIIKNSVPSDHVSYLDPSIATLVIKGVRPSYTLDYTSATAIIPAVANVSGNIVAEFIPLKSTNIVDSQASFKAVLPAQVLAAGVFELIFTIGQKNYTWSKLIDISTVEGKNSNITLKVSKTGVSIDADDITLTDWNAGSDDEGDVIL